MRGGLGESVASAPVLSYYLSPTAIHHSLRSCGKIHAPTGSANGTASSGSERCLNSGSRCPVVFVCFDRFEQKSKRKNSSSQTLRDLSTSAVQWKYDTKAIVTYRSTRHVGVVHIGKCDGFVTSSIRGACRCQKRGVRPLSASVILSFDAESDFPSDV
ncbi:unnamed protein product [Soboliphyme baturini]|uniref:Uncharacterized protein n=1 Tax=Soboliphyme baturini TaxID=241478 RepID=A0A183ISC8_9BILA|nr:unnamed protein product [Soboliphyme baturini]